jgi:hypothetical protein
MKHGQNTERRTYPLRSSGKILSDSVFVPCSIRGLGLVALVLLCAAGCGGSNIVPVSGRVTLDDKPLPNATVHFHPLSEEKYPGPSSAAKTNAQGEFTMKLATSGTPGALVGKHKVIITAYDSDAIPNSSGGGIVPKGLVPRRYNVDSELTFEVPPEGSTSANFDLKSQADDAK